MALNKVKLAKGIKKAFDDGHKIVKKNDKADMHWEIAKRMADSIDKYIRGGDVKVDTDTPNVKITPGIAYPEKFFNSLKLVKANIVDEISYSDHYIYNENDLLY